MAANHLNHKLSAFILAWPVSEFNTTRILALEHKCIHELPGDDLQEEIYDFNLTTSVLVGLIPSLCHDSVPVTVSSMLTRIGIMYGIPCKNNQTSINP